MVRQRNRWICSGQEFIGYFDAPWSECPEPDHSKGTCPWTLKTSLFFLSNVLSRKHRYHTCESSTSTSWFLWFSFSVIKLLSYWMSSRITPLQVLPCPHFLGPLNWSVSDEPGSSVDAPSLLLVASVLSKVVYCTFIEPKPSLDTSRGGSPR